MTIIVIAIIIFLLMLLFPLVMSMGSVKRKQSKALDINESRYRDPRYFALSFKELMEKSLQSYDGSGTILMSKRERLLEADTQEDYPSVCQSVVYAREKEFHPPAGINFEKEIYACQDAYLDGCFTLRAIYGEKDVVLGEGTQVLRWADAEGTLSVYDHSTLGISASSANMLVIGRDCVFRRLYAPVINLGWSMEDREGRQESAAAMTALAISSEVLRNIRYVDEDNTDDDGVLSATVVSKHDVSVLEGFTVKGHIRSHKAIMIYDNAVVYGNLFAEGDIYLGENVRVYGNIFTQQKIVTQRGVRIGQYGEIKSVIARDEIVFGADCKVFGYVSSEARGICCPDADWAYLDPEEEAALYQQRQGSLRKTSVLPVTERAVFASAAEFDEMSAEVFRKNRYLREAVIPEGVRIIRRSFFYQCENLTKVSLPSTLETIEAYAFCGCGRLSELSFSRCSRFKEIQDAAFEGCVSLTHVSLPDSLVVLGSAAFSGCRSLERVENLDGCHLTELAGHVFLNCVSLKELQLPQGLTRIGLSAFRGCSSLLRMTIPQRVAQLGGYAFYGCRSLQELQFLCRDLELDPWALRGIPQSTRLLAEHAQARQRLLELREGRS